MKRTILALALLGTMIAGSAAYAGAFGGPRFAIGEFIIGYETIQYDVTFSGGEWANLILAGDGFTNLDVYVYDQFGNLIASDTYYGDDCEVTWYVPYAQIYTICVVNRGSSFNFFDIITN